MKTGKKMLAVMFAVVFMMVAGAGLAHADEIFGRWGEQIQADLKSGMSLEQVMANGQKKGIPIGKVVEGCIKAGVKPADVVYIAIRDNKGSASAIVKAALNLGAKFDDVVLAAKSAGASKTEVLSGMKKSNTNTNQDAMKVIAIFESKTLLYSPPADNKSAADTRYSSSVFIYSVITTGGNTPSTKTGSPI